MATLRTLRSVAAVALTGAATALGVAAKMVGRGAEMARPPTGARAPAAPGGVTATGAVQARTQETVPGMTTAREPATHVAELAARPASEVVARVPELSTEELRLLLEHEQAGQARPQVLEAIERAASEHAG